MIVLKSYNIFADTVAYPASLLFFDITLETILYYINFVCARAWIIHTLSLSGMASCVLSSYITFTHIAIHFIVSNFLC